MDYRSIRSEDGEGWVFENRKRRARKRGRIKGRGLVINRVIEGDMLYKKGGKTIGIRGVINM